MAEAKLMGDMYFSDKLVRMPMQGATDLEVIESMAGRLVEEGLVKESYVAAIVAREKVFATGLDLGVMGIAIPHTDAEHVNTAAMQFAILENPVEFSGMGDPDTKVQVKLVFMLAIKEAHTQIEVLEKLLGLAEEPEKFEGLAACTNESEAYDMILSIFGA